MPTVFGHPPAGWDTSHDPAPKSLRTLAPEHIAVLLLAVGARAFEQRRCVVNRIEIAEHVSVAIRPRERDGAWPLTDAQALDGLYHQAKGE